MKNFRKTFFIIAAAILFDFAVNGSFSANAARARIF